MGWVGSGRVGSEAVGEGSGGPVPRWSEHVPLRGEGTTYRSWGSRPRPGNRLRDTSG
nr:MAG TPA: hypothetical protein [Caudoviricetes sp.]